MASKSLFVQITILIAVLAILTGCETHRVTVKAEDPPPAPIPQRPDPQLVAAMETIDDLQAKTAVLKQSTFKQKERNLELQLQLLEKESRIAQLLQAHSQAVQEVVRAKARLRSRHSKAETVANLAELKLSLKNAQAQETGEQPHALLRARQYLAMVEVELEQDNFEGASYLMEQARRSLEQMKSSENGTANQDAAFPVPLKMKVARTANLRSGPNRKQRVLLQLKAGAQVSALDRNGLWIQVRTGDEKTGWVHFSLLKTD